MNPIAYLIEPISVSTTGILRGSSLRTYEVEYWSEPSGSYYRPTKVKPTGRVFILENNEIKIKKTKAKLTNKWFRSTTVTSNVADVPYYGCRLFSSPELALLAKSIAIRSRAKALVHSLERQLHVAKNTLESIPDSSSFTDQYPEYLV